ncbi:hypothetical protein G3O08_14635 [Cryomorpha ignava]|uniref:Type I restriction enzyme R protein C-terminal domain-containing protein n=1 Tax=Cryomorpha ignava TaxID=101383 RepID=A0A7K3WSS0_9FLAO|nr:hypothetical protein [Cryomorpha ignava]NEN24739.1 hypothetical protein [Cryomorpha ignava]
MFNLLGTETSLRSIRELIEKFILENLPVFEDADEVEPAFDQYWSEEQQKAFKKLVTEENLSPERTEKLIEDYLFAEREPMRDQVLELIEGGHPSARGTIVILADGFNHPTKCRNKIQSARGTTVIACFNIACIENQFVY